MTQGKPGKGTIFRKYQGRLEKTGSFCNFSWHSEKTWESIIIALHTRVCSVVHDVRSELSRQLSILLFIASEPHKLDRQKYISLESSFHKLFKTTTFRHLRDIGKTLSLLDNYVFRINRSMKCISSSNS